MKPRERLAWLLVVVLTASATALWWRGRDRYEFRASSNGAIVWKLDRQSGKAWLAAVRDKVWKPVAEPIAFTFEEARFGAGNTTNRSDIFDDLVPTNHAAPR